MKKTKSPENMNNVKIRGAYGSSPADIKRANAIRDNIVKRYENPSSMHWSGSYMFALENAFDRLGREFEEQFHIAFNLAPPNAYEELDEHRSYLRKKLDVSLQFFRQCWKDRYETPNDTAYWKRRCELAENVLDEVKKADEMNRWRKAHSSKIFKQAWEAWEEEKDKQKHEA